MGHFLLPLVFVALGLLIFTFGFVLSRRVAKFLKNANPTTGTLVEWKEAGRQRHRKMYQPVFRYEDAHGVIRENGLDESTSHPPYRVGTEKKLLVGKVDPNRIMVDSFSGKWLGILIVFAMGGIFLFLGGIFAAFQILSR